jgi:hypothetical protein
MLLHVANSPSQQDCGLGSNILLAHFHLAPLRLDQAIEAAKERGLARPAFSYQRDGMTSRNVNAHIVERDHTPEVMRDIARSQRGRHVHKSDSGVAQPLSPNNTSLHSRAFGVSVAVMIFAATYRFQEVK